jgi:DUF1680 family protein
MLAIILTTVFLCIPATALIPVPVIKDSIADKFTPAKNYEKTYTDFINYRMKLNSDFNKIHQTKLWAYNSLMAPSGGAPDYSGEYCGKYIDAAILAWNYTGDSTLKSIVDNTVAGLIAKQQPDGYLGNYVDSCRWTRWDIWNQKYTMLGFMSHYILTGSDAAINSSEKIADLMCHVFLDSVNGPHINKVGGSYGMASTGVLEAIVPLFRYVGKQKYLDFCNYIVSAWGDTNGAKLLTLADGATLSSLPSNKAYQMIACYIGLIDFYRLTGSQKYLDACLQFWNEIKTKKLFLHGGCDASEHFKGDYSVNKGSSEGCTHVSWLQFNWHLFRLTGDPRYVAELERNTFNALTGAICPNAYSRTGLMVYGLALNGVKGYSDGLCCQYSIPRGMSLVSEFMAGRLNDDAAVLLYAPGKYNVPVKGESDTQTVNLFIKTDYPYSGSVQIAVTPAREDYFTVKLYVPEWCGNFRATIGGDEFAGVKGEFLSISRDWISGDEIFIEMDLTWQMVSAGPLFPGKIAVKRGPQLMSFDTSITDQANFTLPANWTGVQLYRDATGTKVMVPFSDAGQLRLGSYPNYYGPFYNLQTIVDSILLPDNSTGKETLLPARDEVSINTAPNPFNPSLTISVSNWKTGADLSVLDISGRVVANLTALLNNRSPDMGLRQVAWNASGRASGVYVILLRYGKMELKRKAMLIR